MQTVTNSEGKYYTILGRAGLKDLAQRPVVIPEPLTLDLAAKGRVLLWTNQKDTMKECAK